MHFTKSGLYFLTYLQQNTKPILSRQTWKIHTEMHFSSLERNSAGVGEFFGLLKKQLLLQSRKKRREEEELSSSFFSYDTSIIPKFNAPRKWYEKSKQKRQRRILKSNRPWKKNHLKSFFFIPTTLFVVVLASHPRVLSIAIVGKPSQQQKTWFAWWTMVGFFCAGTWFQHNSKHSLMR